MSKAKKVSSPKSQIEELHSSLSKNIKKSIDLLTELNTTISNIFDSKKIDNSELEPIMKEFLKKCSHVDSLKDAVKKIHKENNSTLKKINTLLTKSMKGVDSSAKEDMDKLQSEYLSNVDKISTIESELKESQTGVDNSIKSAG